MKASPIHGFIKFVGLLMCVSCYAWLSADAADNSEKPPRLDDPVNDENSVLVRFFPSNVLRVPKLIFSSTAIPDNPKQQLKAESIHMKFQYPSMLVGGGESDMNILFEKQLGKYKTRKDTFPVDIVALFNSAEDYGIGVPGSEGIFPYPRPTQIELNLRCTKKIRGECIEKMRAIPSGIPGIDALSSEDWLFYHPEDLTVHLEDGGVYYAQPKAPYELWMNCDRYSGVKCVAHVYDKQSHYQYKMIFPAEAVVHVDELVRKINEMVRSWVVE